VCLVDPIITGALTSEGALDTCWTRFRACDATRRADPMCLPARKAECDPAFQACLSGAVGEGARDTCWAHFRECAHRWRMPTGECTEPYVLSAPP
jgi:hypothetical protein